MTGQEVIVKLGKREPTSEDQFLATAIAELKNYGGNIYLRYPLLHQGKKALILAKSYADRIGLDPSRLYHCAAEAKVDPSAKIFTHPSVYEWEKIQKVG